MRRTGQGDRHLPVFRFAVCMCLLATAIATAHDVEQRVDVERYILEVSDMQRALTFYEGVLGLTVIGELDFPSRATTNALGLPQLRVSEVLLQAGADGSLGLIEYEGDSSPLRKGAFTHVTRHIDQFVANAAQLGLRISEERRAIPGDNSSLRYRIVTDWDGNLIRVEEGVPDIVVAGECVAIGDLASWHVFNDRNIFCRGNCVEECVSVVNDKSPVGRALYALRFAVPSSDGVMCIDNARIAYMDAGLRRTCRVDLVREVLNVEEARRLVIDDLNNQTP